MKTGHELAFIEHLGRIGRQHLIEQGGRAVCWREFGAGPPVVLVHGGHVERTYEIIRASWHWVQYDAAAEVNRRLLDWFAMH